MSEPRPQRDLATTGACHCGAVAFEVTVKGGLASARRCSCSYCAMRGAVAVTADLDAFRILRGAERLTLYQFNTMTARHWFCEACGIYTHHQRRSNPKEYGVNLACLAGMSPFDLAEVVVTDGVNHPRDAPHAPPVAGLLRFERKRVAGVQGAVNCEED